uniref:RNA helicase n=2 Tax=Eptatretus burgeri TaxID=7764 RepID=A0A8C4R6Q4_EPTBU
MFCSSSRSGMACRDRHSLIAEKGSHLNTRLALGSTVTVYVTSILDAARFLGCVESNSEVDLSDRELDREQVATSSLRITGKMSVFFAQHSPVMPKRVKLGCLYAFRQNGEVFSRVRVCGLPQAKAMGHGWPVPICFVDEGRLGWARLEHLAELPLHLSVLQPLCTEVVLCRLCPADRGFTWPPRAMQYMAEKLVGTKLKGRVVLALGNTLWLDPLVFLNVLPGTRMQTVEFSARGLLLTSGLAVPAPEHLTHLALLCKQAGLPGPFISGMQKESVSKPGSPTTRTEIADQETKCPKYEVIQETGLSLPVIVSAFDSPLLFYIQKKELLPRLDELHDKLNELGGVEMKQDETVSLQKQDLCLAQFPLDKKWYRGKLIEPVNETTWEVLFLDYGDTTNVPLVQIKPLPSQFLNLPFQAVRCSLFSINLPDRCFTESHSDSLWQNLHLKTYVATLISVSENGDGRQHFVELEENGISLASQLVRCGMAQPSSVALPRLFEVKETNNTSSPDDICELCAMLYLLLGCDKGSLKRLQATAALQIWADTIEPSNGNLSLAQWWRALMATANLLPYLTAPEELTAVVTALVLALRKCLDEDEKLLHRNFLDKAIVALCFVLDKAECVTARVPALTALTHLTAQKNHEQYSLKLLASACQQLHGGDPFSTPYDACIILAGLPDSCEPLLAEVLLNTNSVSSLCALLETASLPVAIHRAACQVIMKTAKHSDCICGKLQQTGGVDTIFHFVSVSHNSQAVKLALMALKQLFTRVEDLVPTFEEQARATVARFLPLNLDILQIMMECNQKSLWNIPVDLSQIKIRCCPEVLWHQQTDKIILTVMICEAKDFLFDIEEDCVTLSACSANICYTLKLQLFAPVREAKSTCCIRTLHITISLEKQHPASWPRLLENSRIHRNIHCNIESLSDSTCRRLPAFSGKKTEGKAPSERNSDLWDSASESNTSATSSENMIALVNPLLPL